MSGISVLIAIPSGSSWEALFGMSLAGLVAYSNRPFSDGSYLEALKICNTRGSILSRSRHKLVQEAQEYGVTHILFLDSDMSFPPDTLFRLLGRKRAIVACNCPTKMLPSTPTARLIGNDFSGEPMYSVKDDTGVRQVWRVGTGVMLIDLRVFDKMPQPWFPITWNEELNDYTGEDWAFCEKAQSLGIPVYVDMSLSREIGHVGSFEFKHTHVEIPLKE